MGIDPSGRVVGRIKPFGGVRSPDGTQLYALFGDRVEIYSAASGQRIRTIPHQTLGRAAASSDGRYLAIVGGNAVEVVDLEAGRASVPLKIAHSGWPQFGADSKHLYVYSETRSTALRFDGSTLAVDGEGRHVKDGKITSLCSPYGPAATARLLPDGRTLAAFCPEQGVVWWLDLERRTVVGEIGVDQPNPFWVVPVYSPDNTMLYLQNGTKIQVVDLGRRALVLKTTLAISRTSSLWRWLASRFVVTAEAGYIGESGVVSPNGKNFYAAFGSGSHGVSVYELPDLKLKATWLREASFEALWISGDGKTLYARTGQHDDRIYVISSEGKLVASTPLGKPVLRFDPLY
jgi:hypothetical protein